MLFWFAFTTLLEGRGRGTAAAVMLGLGSWLLDNERFGYCWFEARWPSGEVNEA